jgi:hypothetical protein
LVNAVTPPLLTLSLRVVPTKLLPEPKPPTVPPKPLPQVAAPTAATVPAERHAGELATKFPFVKAVAPPLPTASLTAAPTMLLRSDTAPNTLVNNLPVTPLPHVTAPAAAATKGEVRVHKGLMTTK